MKLWTAIQYVHEHQGLVIEVVHKSSDAIEIADAPGVIAYGAALSRIPNWLAFLLTSVGYFKI